MHRLRVLLDSYSSTFIEYLSGVALLMLGIWFASPTHSAFSVEPFEPLQAVMDTELLWALVLLVAASYQIFATSLMVRECMKLGIDTAQYRTLATYRKHVRHRKHAAFINFCIFAAIEALVIYHASHYISVALLPCFALANGITYLRFSDKA